MSPAKVSQPAETAPDVRHIAEVLQAESVPLAVATAALFLQRPEGMTFPLGLAVGDLEGATAPEGHESLPGGQTELRQMVEANFVRLAYTVSLAVLVDEPGVIADDLSWVKEMLSWRGMTAVFPQMPVRLFEAFEDASSSYLSPGEAERVVDILSRAERLLGARQPLSS